MSVMRRLTKAAQKQVKERVNYLLLSSELTKHFRKAKAQQVIREFPELSQLPPKIVVQMIKKEGFDEFVKRMEHEKFKLKMCMGKLLGS